MPRKSYFVFYSKVALLAAVFGAMLLLLLAQAPAAKADTTNHGPIYIVGDNSFTPANGVNGGGSGTQSDPYIIENWTINASGAHGIHIQNTTAYFIVRNCLVENGGSSHNGIELYNVINGRIKNNTCRNNVYGIRLGSSSNDNLTNNTCENNLFGIILEGSSYNNLTNDNCSNNNYDGIDLEGPSNYNTLSNNTCSNNNYMGICLDSSSVHIPESPPSYNPLTNNTLSNNTCSNNNYDGIRIFGPSSDNNTISLNYPLNNADNNVYDSCTNYWDNNGMGNYWSDWQPGMVVNGVTLTSSNGVTVNQPKPIAGGGNYDYYPLVISGTTTTTTTTTTSPTTTGTTTTTQPPAGTSWVWIGVGIAIVAVIAIVAWALMRKK
jgi:parallel beta-helix repeat protein